MIKTLWTSEATSPQNGEPFFKVKEALGYYIFGERLGVDSLAFVLYDRDFDRVGVIHEKKPPLGKDVFKTTAFGGSLDNKALTVDEICAQEVKEEAGYEVDDTRIYYLGQVLVSTQMNQHCHLHLVDVTNLTQGEQSLEETESGSKVKWLNFEEVFALEDWKALTILVKADTKGLL